MLSKYVAIFLFGLFGCGGESQNNSQIQEAWHVSSDPIVMIRGDMYQLDLASLPLTGEVAKAPWSGYYWPSYKGGIAYRWQLGYDQAGFDYDVLTTEQAKALNENQDLAMILSPAEKYDLLNNDYQFTTVKAEKDRTRILFALDNQLDIPTWEGLCHAWAPATLDLSNPAPVALTNEDGVSIPFGSSDVKALITLATHDAMMANELTSQMSGLRCNLNFEDLYRVERVAERMVQEIESLPEIKRDAVVVILNESRSQIEKLDLYYFSFQVNWLLDRLAYSYIDNSIDYKLDEFREDLKRNGPQSLACRDVNAGSFHLILTNLLGQQGKGFIVDMTRDLEVWNQPVVSFQSDVVQTYAFEDFDTLKTELNLPLERQMNPAATSAVLVQTELQVVSEIGPQFAMSETNNLMSLYYEYYLELDKDGLIVGGTWVESEFFNSGARPDFLWTSTVPDFVGQDSLTGAIFRASVACAKGKPLANSECL